LTGRNFLKGEKMREQEKNLDEKSELYRPSKTEVFTLCSKFPDPYSISLQKGLHLYNGQDTLQLKQSSSSLTTVKSE